MGDTSLTCRSCRIDIIGIRADSLTIDNSYDGVNVENFSGKRCDVRLKQSNFWFQFNELKEYLNVDGRYSDVNVALPAGLSPSYNLKTRYGKIYNDTPQELSVVKNRVELSVSLTAQKPDIIVTNHYGDIKLKVGLSDESRTLEAAPSKPEAEKEESEI